jgi:hypothetical protein
MKDYDKEFQKNFKQYVKSIKEVMVEYSDNVLGNDDVEWDDEFTELFQEYMFKGIEHALLQALDIDASINSND